MLQKGEGSPSSSKGPLKKTCTCIMHACARRLAKILALVKRAEEPAQHMALTEAERWAALSTALKAHLQGSAWELLKQGIHGSYLLGTLLIFCNPEVCSHLSMQAPANTVGAVIILQLHRLKTCKDG